MSWRRFLKNCTLAAIFFVSTNFMGTVSEDVECFNTPPGVSSMARGVDVTQVDLIPLNFHSNNGFRSPVIKMTCNEKRKFINGPVAYQLPDQIWHIANKPGGSLLSAVHLYKSSSDLRSRMSLEVGGGAFLRRFAFSASGSYSKFQQIIMTTENYISDVSSLRSSKRVDLKPEEHLEFDNIARKQLRTYVGNDTYQSNPEAYQRFINDFGTHYFSEANFGGKRRSVYKTEKNYFHNHTDEEVKAKASANFMRIISAEEGITDHSSAENKHFKTISNKEVIYYGGKTNLKSSGSVQDWQSTVDENPWLLSGKLKPISDLIRNDAQRSSMEKARTQHIMRAHLVEEKRKLAIVKSKQGETTTTQKLEAKLAAMEALPVGTLVEEDVENTDWFIDHLLDQLRNSQSPYSIKIPNPTVETRSRNSAVRHYTLSGLLLILAVIVAISVC